MESLSSESKALKVKSLLAGYYADERTDQADLNLDRIDSEGPNEDFSKSYSSPAPSIAGGAAIRSDAAIDRLTFDADAYLRRMVKETRLGSLVDEHRSLVAEVGSLDSDMQTLVYENYNKFIVATDIIRTLDQSMSGMDGQLKQLEKLISGVAERSEAVNGTLEKRQAAIMELNQARVLLQKLQVVLSVPRKLRAAVDSGAYDVAAETYREAAPVLAKHGHRAALRDVAAEVEQCRVEAAERLRSQLLSHPESAAETIALIAQLDEPIESLQDDFLGCQRQRLAGILRDAQAALESAPFDGLQAALTTADAKFIAQLNRTGTLFTQLFDASCRPRLVGDAREWLLRYTGAVRGALLHAAEASVAAAVGLDTAGHRLPGGHPTAPPHSTNFSRDWGTAGLVGAVSTLCKDLPQLEEVFPELAPRDKASEVVGNAVRQHVALAFTALEARISVEIQELGAELAAPSAGLTAAERQNAMETGLGRLHSVALTGLERAFEGVSEWASSSNGWLLEGWSDVFATLVHSQLANWLQAVPRRCLAAAGLQGPPPSPAISGSEGKATPFHTAWGSHAKQATGSSLGSAGVLLASHAPTPPGVFILALSAFCSTTGAKLAVRAAQLLQSGRTRSGVALGAADFGTAAQEAATALLHAYVAATVATTTQAMQYATDATAWGQHPEPKAPTSACIELLDRLAEVDGELAAAERAAGSAGALEPAGSRPHHRRQSTGGGSEGGIGTGVSSLPVAWSSRGSVVCQVAAAGVQARAAALKQHTLSRAGFQQVQLDCHFLRPHLQRVGDGVEGAQAVLSAVDEVLMVAAERCAEPVMLEPAALDRMVASSARRN